jgi:pimeloyl-ACP methyl ester carboxylesterase
MEVSSLVFPSRLVIIARVVSVQVATIRRMRLAPVHTAISFWDGVNRLVGELVLPPWEGPYPVAVLVDGYGPEGRGRGIWQTRLASAGVASLAYDKPGCGKSTGDWVEQTLEDRTAETAAAIAAVRSHDAVSPDLVALLGSGHGGWISLLTAQAGAGVAAVVMISSPVIGALPLEEYRLARRLENGGYSSAESALALALLRERIRRLVAGETPRSVIAAEAACHNASWYQLMPGVTEEEISYLSRITSFDPTPALHALHAPLLALYGAGDTQLPVEDNARKLREVLEAGGHRDHEIVLVPDADHLLRPPSGLADGDCVPDEDPDDMTAPGVFEFLVTWLDRRLGRVDSSLTLTNP